MDRYRDMRNLSIQKTNRFKNSRENCFKFIFKHLNVLIIMWVKCHECKGTGYNNLIIIDEFDDVRKEHLCKLCNEFFYNEWENMMGGFINVIDKINPITPPSSPR